MTRDGTLRTASVAIGIVLLSAGALGGLAWLAISPFGAVTRYDEKTVELGHHLGEFTETQWEKVYQESERIFLLNAGREGRRALEDHELPSLLRNLGFDECYSSAEGVFYCRVGGGWSEGNTAQIHCIYSPKGPRYDRMGIWFDGYRKFEWVYEPGGHARAEQGSEQPPIRTDLSCEGADFSAP